MRDIGAALPEFAEPEVGEEVRLYDMSTGTITNVLRDEHGIARKVIVRESDTRWHVVDVDQIEPRRYDA